MSDLLIKHGLLGLDPELLLLPSLLELHLVVVHHVVCPVQVGLDGHALPHYVLHPVITREASPGGHVPVKI